jgi:hypothetical protein
MTTKVSFFLRLFTAVNIQHFFFLPTTAKCRWFISNTTTQIILYIHPAAKTKSSVSDNIAKYKSICD